jgi:hypothetical protein
MVIIYVLGIVLLLIILSKLVKTHKKTNNGNNTDLHKYLLGELTLNTLGNINKPILWIHVPIEYNSRHWESFGSRATLKLNQPYLYLTTQLIINKCMDSFHIVIIDDHSFTRLIPHWTYSLSYINPMVRLYGFLELLYMYGGMITPISFICFKDLINLYKQGTKNNSMFVCENINYDTIYNHTFMPDTNFMGATKECHQVMKFSQYIKKNILDSFTYTEPSYNKIGEVLIAEISNKKINLIPGYEVGTMNSNMKPITIDNLMSYTYLSLHSGIYGIWIPHAQILKRTKYQWFARLSECQIEQSQLIICKYIMNSYRTTNSYVPCQLLSDTQSNNPILPETNPDVVTMWVTPLINKGIYGLKPIYLGGEVLTASELS